MRLVQLIHPQHGRHVARVAEPRLKILSGPASTYALALEAHTAQRPLSRIAAALRVKFTVDYDEVYAGRSAWRLLPAFDHPAEPARCLVAGTGLTHTASARQRDAMHAASGKKRTRSVPLTDSMRMFRLGLEHGRPTRGEIGAAPEWFYKGDGSILRAHGEPLVSPAFADDGGEEPEIAGCYVIAPDGTPCRIGIATGNEFSDHVHERKNYLYLAESKLRPVGLGPELLLGPVPAAIRGRVSIERAGRKLWSAVVSTGEKNMSHTLANLEHHHFKHPSHRRPGDAHVHFFGADAFSFGAQLRLQDGDRMVISWTSLGRPLVNPLHVAAGPQPLVAVRTL